MSQYASGIILLGMSRHKILAQVAAVEGVLNLVLSIVLVKHMGLMGVAVGTVVPHAISVVVVIPLYTLRATGLSVREYIAQAYARPLLSAIPTGALCYVLSTVIHGPSAAVFAGEVLAVCSAYVVLTYFVSLTKDEKMLLEVQLARLGERTGAARIRATWAKRI
jgi:O-antigen/teichoic acid export membrane protein